MTAPAQAAPTPAPPVRPVAAPPVQATASTPANVRASSTTSAATAAIARADAIAASRPTPAAQAKPSTPPSTPPPAPAAPQVSAAPLPTTPAPVAKAAVHPWRTFFAEWPSQIPKRGILITRLNDASPFKAFMMRGDFLLIERTTPDSLGGRFLVIPYDEISTVKFTDPLKQQVLEAAGFEGQLSF